MVTGLITKKQSRWSFCH